MVLQQDSALPAHRPEVFDAAHSWVELRRLGSRRRSPAREAPDKLTVGVCAAGHKAMYNDDWGGYPDAEFLAQLDPKLGELRDAAAAARRTRLTARWAG